MTTTIPTRTKLRRVVYATLALVLLASVVVAAATHGTGYWQIVTFAVGPDLTLLAGAGHDLQRGQLHPRAVRAYNLAHRLWGPAALIVVGAAIGGQVAWLLGGLTSHSTGRWGSASALRPAFSATESFPISDRAELRSAEDATVFAIAQ